MERDIEKENRLKEIMRTMIFAKRLNSFDRDEITFDEAVSIYSISRGILVEMLELSLQFLVISIKEKEIIYSRLIEYKTLEEVGQKFGVTRERIRQIEAKVYEKMRCLTEIPK